MKRLIFGGFSVLLVFATTTSVWAAGKREACNKDVKDQDQSLLTPEQPAQLRTVEQQDGYGLTIMSALNLSSAQKAQLQQINPVSPEQLESILTPEQHQMWLQMRRANFGGR